jgi:hypothetical protein
MRHNITLKGDQNTFEVSFARTSSRKSLKAKRSGRKGPFSVMVPTEPSKWDCRAKGQIIPIFHLGREANPRADYTLRPRFPFGLVKNPDYTPSSRWLCPAAERKLSEYH